MTQQEPHTFEDPHLKRHCCAIWSKECAPASLCEKIAKMLADESVGRSIRLPAAFWQRPFAGVAAAAVILLVSGVVILQTGSPGSTAQAQFDPQLASDMVSRHDSCCSGHKTHQLAGVPLNDYQALGETISKKLDRPVLAAALPESGWALRGGAICPVGKTPAGHLIFDHGKSSVSVFSLPRSEYAKNGRYQATVNNHPMAGFVDSRGAFCLVGSGDSSLTPEHLAALRDRMQADVVMASDTPERVTVAELLH